MNNWHERALELYSLGLAKSEVYDKLTREGHDLSYHTVRQYIRRQEIKMESQRLAPTPNCVNRPGQILDDSKRVVIQNMEPEHHTGRWDGGSTLKFAIMGDTQFGSKYAQITYLHEFYDLCAKEGITSVYHTGDITDGLKMRTGHEYELYLTSADEMRDDVAANYPKRDGITTYFITGNHDASIYKHIGYDIGQAIANLRDDLVYLGRDCAVIDLTPKCKLELRHPWDGTAYAISYKMQKMIEAMEADSKPNILAVGHYHKAEYLFYRNVHALQTGCFQGQTPFTRGKGISVWMGGWIVTVRLDDEGSIIGFAPEFIPFYKTATDDWKNWR